MIIKKPSKKQKLKIELFWNELSVWFASNARNYPWRITDSTWHVLIAEFLLQQTHVRKVEEVYLRLLQNYPAVNDLANADLDDIEAIIRPLGLIYRAERLIACAKKVSTDHEGRLPATFDELVQLPGVGQYIANAVLCYGFHQDTVPIDTNVIRVFRRYFGLQSQTARAHNDRCLAESIKCRFAVEDKRLANLAVLDFAAVICTARTPKCSECPLSQGCINCVI